MSDQLSGTSITAAGTPGRGGPSNTLSREILRWVQSLDLAYSVKNVRRDFSNGFLVAEIFSRYYNRQIQMHSFDNGTAVSVKRDNWGQLLKFFRKIGLEELITQEEVDNIVHCEPGCAIAFINKIYELLTKRKVQEVSRRPLTQTGPSYSRNTGSTVARQAVTQGPIAEVEDSLARQRKVREVLADHERSTSLSGAGGGISGRLAMHSLSSPSYQQRGGSDDEDDSAPQHVQVKEIQVKQVDRNITQLRAAKQQHPQLSGAGGGPGLDTSMGSSVGMEGSVGSSPALQSRAGADGGGPGAGGVGVGAGAGASGAGGGGLAFSMPPENAVSVMNACITRMIGPEDVRGWDETKDSVQNFVSAMYSDPPAVNDNLAASALMEMANNATELAGACAVTPKQFWRVSDVLTVAITELVPDSDAFRAAHTTFVELGRRLVQRDAAAALPLFCDFALQKMVPTLVNAVNKRGAILKILYAFSVNDPTAHKQCIKRLQGLVSDMQVFVHCLTMLAPMERQMDHDLADLYQYYCIIGLGFTSPRQRAGALTMLGALAPHSPEAAATFWPQLRALQEDDTWWEVQTQILSVAACILLHLEPAPGNASVVSHLEDIVQQLLSPRAPLVLRKLAIVHCAPILETAPALVPRFVDVLLSLPADTRNLLLGTLDAGATDGGQQRHQQEEVIPLTPSSAAPYILHDISGKWHSFSVGKEICERVVALGSENAAAASAGGNAAPAEPVPEDLLEIFGRAVTTAVASADAHSGKRPEEDDDQYPLGDDWTGLVDSVKDSILMCLCSMSTAAQAVSILKAFIYHSALGPAILTESRCLMTMRMLYPTDGSGHIGCMDAFEEFFRDVFNTSPSCQNAVMELLDEFAKSYAAQFEQSSLQSLLKELSSMI